jgi:hypothetical protein
MLFPLQRPLGPPGEASVLLIVNLWPGEFHLVLLFVGLGLSLFCGAQRLNVIAISRDFSCIFCT